MRKIQSNKNNKHKTEEKRKGKLIELIYFQLFFNIERANIENDDV